MKSKKNAKLNSYYRVKLPIGINFWGVSSCYLGFEPPQKSLDQLPESSKLFSDSILREYCYFSFSAVSYKILYGDQHWLDSLLLCLVKTKVQVPPDEYEVQWFNNDIKANKGWHHRKWISLQSKYRIDSLVKLENM